MAPEMLWIKAMEIFELCKGAGHPQYNSNFTDKIGGTPNSEFSNLVLWSWNVESNLKSLF